MDSGWMVVLAFIVGLFWTIAAAARQQLREEAARRREAEEKTTPRVTNKRKEYGGRDAEDIVNRIIALPGAGDRYVRWRGKGVEILTSLVPDSSVTCF